MKLKKVGKVKIGKDSTKGYVYPKLRLPKDFSDLIGEKVNIYEAFLEGGRGILILPEGVGQIGQNELDNLEVVGRKDETEERLSRLEKAIEKLTKLIEE
ncbi:hypothetical protein DRP07_01855 [Archaeoglobales archaeon]|nr:MAG: hypothetical protein DRP07_01855 [Archaeoglobales archaeon]